MNRIDYIITSNRFAGEVCITFIDGHSARYDALKAALTVKQGDWFLSRMSLTEQEFLTELNNAGVFNVVGTRQEITFAMFWDAYDEKDRSSKKKALAKWNRMSKEQQLLAFSYIPTYFKNIPAGIAKKYAETYLNSELWNN